MIEEDREKRIRAAAAALQDRWPRLGILARTVVYRHPSKAEIAGAALDAADRAVPVVSKAYVDEHYVERWKATYARLTDDSRAKLAARDFANALRQISRRSDETDPTSEYHIAINALAAHPDFAEPRA